jgi:hypothetical protein
MRLHPWQTLLALAACAGDKDEATADETTPTGDDDDTIIDTGTESTSTELAIDAAFLLVTSTFGYDPATGMASGYEDPSYGPVPLIVSVLLIDSSFEQTGQITEENACAIALVTEDPQPMASFVADAGVWWGFAMPADAEIVNGCEDFELPADFEGDPAGFVAKWSWGVGVSEVDPANLAELEAQLPPTDFAQIEPFLIGTGAWSTAFEGVVNPEGYLQGAGVAYEADDDFALVPDANGQAVTIPSVDVWDEATMTLSRGVYSASTGAIGPASLLTF